MYDNNDGSTYGQKERGQPPQLPKLSSNSTQIQLKNY